jgi:hypothetical protein
VITTCPKLGIASDYVPRLRAQPGGHASEVAGSGVDGSRDRADDEIRSDAGCGSWRSRPYLLATCSPVEGARDLIEGPARTLDRGHADRAAL